MLLRFFCGVVFACLCGAALLFVAAHFPGMHAASEEARIFNAENADLFGEDPYFYTQLSLREIAVDTIGDYAVVNIDGDERLLRAGDLLAAPCLAVSRILHDAVLLNHCGSYALLWLREPKDSASRMKLQVLNAGAAKPAPLDKSHIVDLRGNSRVQPLVSDYRGRLYDRPLSLLGAIKVDVVISDQGREYYVSPGKDKLIFSALGLAPGDRVRAIDGVNLSGDVALTDIYEHLDEAMHLVLTIERNQQDWVVLLDFGAAAASPKAKPHH